MKALFIKEFGGPEGLLLTDVEDPAPPSRHEVIVRVRAAALNRADILQRRGHYPAPAGFPPNIPGLEFAGEIVDRGGEAERFAVGDRVFGITSGGAQAEYLKTDESLLAAIPEGLGLIEAGAVPEAFITALDALVSQGLLVAGETVLIHAVGSGVGLAALQIAKERGARVFGTSRTPHKLGRCADFGLDAGFGTAGFAAAAREANGGKGVDLILDLVGASIFGANLEALAVRGRLILVGLVGGRRTEFDLGTALAKRLTIRGTVLRSRSVAEKAEATRRFAEEVVPLLRSGAVRPNVDRVFEAADGAEAHRYLESNESFGKVVLKF